MSNTIVFFGNERLATGLSTEAPVLRALLAADYKITAVIVAQNDSGKSRKGRTLEIVQVAEDNGIPVLSPPKLSQATGQIAALGADIGVLVAYGKIVPQAVIDLFPRGIVNIHPSLLPRHRGPTPIESAILDGDQQTGVSIMQLSAAMDAGPVYAQATVPLTGNETKATLANQLGALGKDLLVQSLPGILNGSLQPIQQDDSLATYDKLIEKTAGVLDFNKTATQLEREVRAYAVWPRSRASINSTEVIITKAHVKNQSKDEARGQIGNLWLEEKQLGWHCSQDILVVDSLIPAGKKDMPASAFLAGYQV